MNATDPTLANRYLADQLSEAEQREYEKELLSNPEALSELEATARLKVGLERLRETGELTHLLRDRPRRIPAYALPLAAGVAAIAIGTALWWSTLVGTGAPALLFASQAALVEKVGHALPPGLTVALFSRRAATPVTRFEHPGSAATVELRVLPAASDRSHRYHLSVLRQRDTHFERLAEIGNLTVAEDGFVQVYADAARFPPGHYEVVLADQTAPAGSATESFLFDLSAREKR